MISKIDLLSTYLPHLQEDADDQLSEIASTIPSVDPSCVDLKHSAF